MQYYEWLKRETERKQKTQKPIALKDIPEVGYFLSILQREDREALSDLLTSAQKHIREEGIPNTALSMETCLLCVILELQKEVKSLRSIFAPPLP